MLSAEVFEPPTTSQVSPDSAAALIERAAPARFTLGSGFSAAAPWWSEGPEASLSIDLNEVTNSDVLLIIEARPFGAGKEVRHQVVELQVNGKSAGDWTLIGGWSRRRAVMVNREMLQSAHLDIQFSIKTCPRADSPELAANPNRRGIAVTGVLWVAIAQEPPAHSLVWQLGRAVGAEAQKTFDQKIASGFWERYVSGTKVLDIGFKGGKDSIVVPIFEESIGVDLGYPGYDGRTLPFPDSSHDAVFSSHCLEHIPGSIKAIQEWHRVTKIGGHVIMAVPHAHLYERARRPPSRWNGAHQRFYTAATLLAEVEAALMPNSYRIRHFEENDFAYPYDRDPMQHPGGCYELSLVLQKIEPPFWGIQA